jgi:hypothetical protein
MKVRISAGRGPGGFSKKIVPLALLSCSLAFLGAYMATVDSKGAQRANQPAFVGTWKGTCQDNKPFVIVILGEERGQIVGTVSIANMRGNLEGGCEEVVDDPTPEHAQAIHDAKIEGSTLSFTWGGNTANQAKKFQMKLVGSREAELRFFGTPVEDNPWKLVRDH